MLWAAASAPGYTRCVWAAASAAGRAPEVLAGRGVASREMSCASAGVLCMPLGAGKKTASMDRPPIMRAMGTADITKAETVGAPETTSTN